jgi:membrane protease YdiL (CAAX protease family)
MPESEAGRAVAPVRESPGLARALGFCLLFYVFTIPGEIVGSALHCDALTHVLVDQLVAWPPTLLIAWRTTRRSWSDTFRVRRFPVRPLLPMVTVLVGIAILSQEVAGWIPMPGWANRLMENFEAGGLGTMIAVALVIAPIAEEHLFRGWMLRGLMTRHTPGGAIALSAVLFGMFHFNPWQGIPAVGAGLVLGWIVVRTGSVVPAIIGHAVMNAVPATLNEVLPRMGYAKLDDLDHLPAWLIGSALVLGVIGAVWLRGALPPVATEVADKPAPDA